MSLPMDRVVPLLELLDRYWTDKHGEVLMAADIKRAMDELSAEMDELYKVTIG